MSLGDIYSKQVSGNTVSGLSICGEAPLIERDPQIKQLEHNVFEQLASITSEQKPPTDSSTHTIAVVSFEEALRELAQNR
jgi:hypothetical protein